MNKIEKIMSDVLCGIENPEKAIKIINTEINTLKEEIIIEENKIIQIETNIDKLQLEIEFLQKKLKKCSKIYDEQQKNVAVFLNEYDAIYKKYVDNLLNDFNH